MRLYLLQRLMQMKVLKPEAPNLQNKQTIFTT